MIKNFAVIMIGISLAWMLQFWISPAIGPFYSKVLTDVGINIILAVSLNLVNGLTGQFSIGHAGFMAVGGYTAGAITYYTSFRLWGSADIHGGFFGAGTWLFVLACLVGGLVAAVAGFIVGLPSLRLRGDYLAIVTLGFGEIVRVLIQQTDDALFLADEIKQKSVWSLATHLGGALGFTGLPYYTNLFWVFCFVVIVVIFAYRLKESSFGRVFLAVREDEIAAAAMGIPVTRCKVWAFVFAAFFAGIAGGLFAHEIGATLNPLELGFQKSFDIVIMVVLGGMGSISGSILAAILLTYLPEWLRDPTPIWPATLVLILLTVLFVRNRRWNVVVFWVAFTVIVEGLRYLARLQEINLGDYRMILYAICLILMMILKPQGLFGLHETWKLPFLWRSRLQTV